VPVAVADCPERAMVVAPLTSGASTSAVVSGVVAASPPVTVAAVFSSEELPPMVPLSPQAERHPASSAALMIMDRIWYLRFIFGSSLQSMIP